MSLSDQQAKIVLFNSKSRYLNEALNIDNPYFVSIVNQTYPPELQFSKANASNVQFLLSDNGISRKSSFHFNCRKTILFAEFGA